jgi:hypothetical protein
MQGESDPRGVAEDMAEPQIEYYTGVHVQLNYVLFVYLFTWLF